MAKSSNVSASSFARSSAKSANKTLEMLRETFGEHSLSRAVVLE
jgi:hypothetical protein